MSKKAVSPSNVGHYEFRCACQASLLAHWALQVQVNNHEKWRTIMERYLELLDENHVHKQCSLDLRQAVDDVAGDDPEWCTEEMVQALKEELLRYDLLSQAIEKVCGKTTCKKLQKQALKSRARTPQWHREVVERITAIIDSLERDFESEERTR